MNASGTARRAPHSARREEDRIKGAAVFAQRRSAAASDRDEGWKRALNAHIQAIFCGGMEKYGLRALANSKGARPLPWPGWLSRRKGHGLYFPDASFNVPSPICSSSRSAPFPGPCASFLYNEGNGVCGDGGRQQVILCAGGACSRNDNRSRRNA